MTKTTESIDAGAIYKSGKDRERETNADREAASAAARVDPVKGGIERRPLGGDQGSGDLRKPPESLRSAGPRKADDEEL
ncbi:hypothetical protein CQ12_30460 [Bradyrhizobium jicamae]|uniref:Uncharacterized protein n=1 Tax=Bradyrhizobium jicamae TaxID=280332 RepID=A0A0R3KI90_9BRAD|nr:hypothetical protein [Bradyrhizobium jicamae]KRQ92940.1 hypothetical protein CQ12_30460 [Bradyrhizobium jicamae]